MAEDPWGNIPRLIIKEGEALGSFVYDEKTETYNGSFAASYVGPKHFFSLSLANTRKLKPHEQVVLPFNKILSELQWGVGRIIRLLDNGGSASTTGVFISPTRFISVSRCIIPADVEEAKKQQYYISTSAYAPGSMHNKIVLLVI